MPKLTVDVRHLIRQCPECSRRFSQDAAFCPFDGANLAVTERVSQPADPLIAQTVDERYVIEHVLGEGGMGTVYRARHTMLGRALAVKVLRADLAQEADLAARFLQEAQATAAIKHPNIVSISDFGRLPDGRPYFVMELLQGRTLASRMKEGRLPPPLAIEIATRIATGLAAAHDAGVIHRDLKPENVFLLDEVGKDLRVVDFGAALIIGASRLTKAGVVFGTPFYMSPEQAAGKPVDPRADVYALGVILYEMLTGHVPFEGDTYMGVLTQHMFVAPRPPSELIPDMRALGGVERVVMRALEKEPSRRFDSMATFEVGLLAAVEVQDGVDGRTMRSLPPAAALRAPEHMPSFDELRERVSDVAVHRPAGRWRPWMGLALVVLAAVVVVAVVQLRDRAAPRPPAVSSAIEPMTSPVSIPPPPPSSSVHTGAGATTSLPSGDRDSKAPVLGRTTKAPAQPSATARPRMLPPDPFEVH